MNFNKVLKGKYNQAIVYNPDIEVVSENQILSYLNSPLSKDSQIRIMPDVHVGMNNVVGFTATLNEYVIPGIIGVDIGCGVNAYHLGKLNLKMEKLNHYVYKHIPAGQEVNQSVYEGLEKVFGWFNPVITFTDFMKNLENLCERLSIHKEYIYQSLGTLGSGNHFIEIDMDDNRDYWLLLHSGSRYLGFKIAEFYEKLTIQEDSTKIKYLTGENRTNYLNDMQITLLYARFNRLIIAYRIIEEALKLDFYTCEIIESIHNYIDMEDHMIRKGAIAAHQGQKIIIPFSMADGGIIAKGKGNPEWNFSAPHGSGRKMHRIKARQSLDMDQFRKQMKGIWSTCIRKDTLDESPMAYRKGDSIIHLVEPTLEVLNRLKPVYNFKAGD